jgi:hypothetical protein
MNNGNTHATKKNKQLHETQKKKKEKGKRRIGIATFSKIGKKNSFSHQMLANNK